MIPWRELPAPLGALRDLALDLRWTWSHEADALWARVDDGLWRRTRNPWTILEDVSIARLAELAADASFVAHLDQLVAARGAYLADRGWFAKERGGEKLAGAAWFSMEFGLGEALPLYAGGLGVLAGDFLKSASDLGVPVIGIGLLYQEGYFRQMIDAEGRQFEAFPYNDPSSMPVAPARTSDGGWLRIPVELPGRTLQLRVWPTAPRRSPSLRAARTGERVPARRRRRVPRSGGRLQSRDAAPRSIAIRQHRGRSPASAAFRCFRRTACPRCRDRRGRSPGRCCPAGRATSARR